VTAGTVAGAWVLYLMFSSKTAIVPVRGYPTWESCNQVAQAVEKASGGEAWGRCVLIGENHSRLSLADRWSRRRRS